MTSEEVVDLLKKSYQDELETVMNYLANSIIMEGVKAQEVAEDLEKDIQEELTHAQQLGERLKQIGERPPASGEFEARQHSLQPPEDARDVLVVIDGVIDAEEDAIETYRALIKAAEKADDPVTEDLAVTLLADEEAHRTDFKSFRREFE